MQNYQYNNVEIESFRMLTLTLLVLPLRTTWWKLARSTQRLSERCDQIRLYQSGRHNDCQMRSGAVHCKAVSKASVSEAVYVTSWLCYD